MSITRKVSVSAFFIGAMTFGYAQSTENPAQESQVEAQAQIQEQGDPAVEALKKQIEANPNDTEALVKLATAYQDKQDWPNALQAWDKITTLLPDWAPGYYSKGIYWEKN